MDQHTISLFVNNKPGVLLRVALIFSRRAFNIESLVVSSAMDGKYSRMTITASGDSKTLEEIIKQANNLVDVIHAGEHIESESIEKELAFIKMKINATNRTEILQIVDNFKSETVDLTHESLIIQVTGKTDKLDAMIELLSHYEVIEIVRTGKVVMARGDLNT